MLDFKKFSGKVGQARKDYGVNIDSVITKNTEIYHLCFNILRKYIKKYSNISFLF